MKQVPRSPAASRRRLFAGLSVCALASLAACGDDGLSPDELTTLRVTGIVVPEAAAVNQSFTVRLTVESSGCVRADRLDATRQASRVDLVAIGVAETSEAGPCQPVVRFETLDYTVAPPFTLPFSVSVLQPDGSRLNGTVNAVAN